MVALAQRIVASASFHNAITAAILFAAVLVGIETSPRLVEAYGPLLHALDRIVLGVFCAEIALKAVAHGKRPWLYFQDGWNVFDFLIVVVCFLPIHAQYATVLRLLRLLRVLRLVHAIPRLQILVSALFKAMPSMGYVTLFLLLHFYVYGVAAVFMFGENDPLRFGNLPTALLTLFTVATMEGWADIMYTQMHGCAAYGYDATPALCTQSEAQPLLAAFYFVSFILLGTMVILNLFIGVITNGMQEAAAENDKLAEKEKAAAGVPTPSLEHELFALHERVGELLEETRRLRERAAAESLRS